jgi:hypothetical protein
LNEDKKIRTFETGATRDTDLNKPDYEGFLSPIVIKRYGEYMNKHRKQSDGSFRDSDNWQKGIPKDEYMKSLFRHFMDLWSEHREFESRDGVEEALCAIIFNSMGYLHETLKEREYGKKQVKTNIPQ